MTEITAALVKELREKSGAGMMDCKKALLETNGDIEAAIDWLRAKGISKADKKAGRAAAEGLVAIAGAGPNCGQRPPEAVKVLRLIGRDRRVGRRHSQQGKVSRVLRQRPALRGTDLSRGLVPHLHR